MRFMKHNTRKYLLASMLLIVVVALGFTIGYYWSLVSIDYCEFLQEQIQCAKDSCATDPTCQEPPNKADILRHLARWPK